MDIATKFVSWNLPKLATLQSCKVYQLRKRLNSGEKLNRSEKNWLTEAVNHNCYFKQSVPCQGYKFDFSDVLRHFWVSQYGQIAEYYAIDKTALRGFLCGRIERIVELK